MLKDKEDTFPKLMVLNCQRGPDAVAVRKKNFGIWKEYSWEESLGKVKYFCLGLIHLGLQPGDRVVIIGENAPEWFWAEFAVQAASATMVAIYPDMIPGEIKNIAEHSECHFAVVDNQEQVDKFLEIKNELPHLQRIIYWDSRGLRNYDNFQLLSFEEVLEIGKRYESSKPRSFDEVVAKGAGEDIAALYYTSGITGPPKPAMVSHRALINSGKAFLECNPVSREENVFSYMPAAGIWEAIFVTCSHLMNGAILNFSEEPETILDDLREIAPHLIFYSPRQWEEMARAIQVRMKEAGILNRLLYYFFLKMGYKRAELLEQTQKRNLLWVLLVALGDLLIFNPIKDNYGMKKCKIPITGSAPLSLDTFRFWHALGVPLKQFYGTTEAGLVAGHVSGEIRYETLGKIGSTASVKISEAGEILVKGSCLFSGYYKDPEKSMQSLTGGWFHSEDAGFIDQKNHLVFLDRVYDMETAPKGTKYAPQSLEGRLRFSPNIKDAMIFSKGNYLAAIIIIDFATVSKWAEHHRINYRTFAELSQKEEVARLIRADIDQIDNNLPEDLKIKKFVLLNKEFNPDEDELSRTGKLRRKFLETRYSQIIQSIYKGQEETEVETFIKYRDGKGKSLKTHIKIWSVSEGA